METYDFLVIGGGSGGLAAARRASSHGARVALIERGDLGGTCVNLGCIPKKILFNASNLARDLELANDYGFSTEQYAFDWKRLKKARVEYIERLRELYRTNLGLSRVELIPGSAEFRGPDTLAVGARTLRAPHLLIATGSRPSVPQVPGAEHGIDSDGFFGLEQKPEQVVVVGSGYVGVELTCVLSGLGARVTLAERGQRLLKRFDPMLGVELEQQMKRDGTEVLRGTEIERVERLPARQLRIHSNRGSVLEADALIWATGRVPNTESLALERAGLIPTAAGPIVVDAFQNTAARGIYAVGDVTGHSNLTPVAIAAGRRLADRLFGNDPNARISYDNVPTVVFSHPPIGSVGLSEPEAVARYGPLAVRIYESRFTNLVYALGERRATTSIKLIVSLPEERLLGIHVIGHAADELIQGFAVVLNLGATKADLDRSIPIHPTAAEELLTLTRSRPPLLAPA